jgi:hypothetical protein
MATRKARHVEDTIGELGSLADTPVDDGEGRILVNVVRIEHEILDSDVEISGCVLVWVFAVDHSVSIEP